MCLVQGSLKEGVSPAVPLKSSICMKDKCSRNTILSTWAEKCGANSILSSSEKAADHYWWGEQATGPTTTATVQGWGYAHVPSPSYFGSGWGDRCRLWVFAIIPWKKPMGYSPQQVQALTPQCYSTSPSLQFLLALKKTTNIVELWFMTWC